jgi:hypothetical protein
MFSTQFFEIEKRTQRWFRGFFVPDQDQPEPESPGIVIMDREFLLEVTHILHSKAARYASLLTISHMRLRDTIQAGASTQGALERANSLLREAYILLENGREDLSLKGQIRDYLKLPPPPEENS